MPAVFLDGRSIGSWRAFHAECQSAFGFPDFYGRNMDAWIDCLCSLRDADGMSKFVLKPDETLEIDVMYCDALRKKAPEIVEALAECVAEVNQRYAENGEKPALSLHLR